MVLNDGVGGSGNDLTIRGSCIIEDIALGNTSSRIKIVRSLGGNTDLIEYEIWDVWSMFQGEQIQVSIEWIDTVPSDEDVVTYLLQMESDDAALIGAQFRKIEVLEDKGK